jgi:hypothetical protein
MRFAHAPRVPTLGLMNTPTLGYEDDTEISKPEVARLQLEEAIRLFVAKKFLCALTLAGAAEEILARLANAAGKPSVTEASTAAIAELKNRAEITGLADVTQASVFNRWNKARNAAKHHNSKESEILTLNVLDEAYWMIRRGLANAKTVGVRIGNEVDFENWVVVNINM